MKFSTPSMGPFSGPDPVTWQGSTNQFQIPALPKPSSAGFETAPNPGTVANQFNQCAYCYASLSGNFMLAPTASLVQFDTFSSNTNGMGDTTANGVRIQRAGFYSITVGMNIESYVATKCAFDIRVNDGIVATYGLNPFSGVSISTIAAVLYLSEGDLITSKGVGDTAFANAATFMRVIELGTHAV